jgi:hypothetical protein
MLLKFTRRFVKIKIRGSPKCFQKQQTWPCLSHESLKYPLKKLFHNRWEMKWQTAHLCAAHHFVPLAMLQCKCCKAGAFQAIKSLRVHGTCQDVLSPNHVRAFQILGGLLSSLSLSRRHHSIKQGRSFRVVCASGIIVCTLSKYHLVGRLLCRWVFG